MSSIRRRAAVVLLGTLASALAACGIGAPLPVISSDSTLGTYANRRPATTQVRRYGMIFDQQTPRVRHVPGRINLGLPAKVDLRKKLSPVDDQGDMNSCTGFAVAGLAEYIDRSKGKNEDLSAGFVYVLELKMEKRLGIDGGARITSGMQVLKRNGIAPEALHPYLARPEQQNEIRLVDYLKTLPSAEAMKVARLRKVADVKPVETLDDFKVALAQGRPVVFGMAVYSSYETDEVKKTGIVPMPDPDFDGFLGGHAILAVGYDDKKKQVIFRNSYSPAWGDRGYGYLPYSYFQKELVGDAWVAL